MTPSPSPPNAPVVNAAIEALLVARWEVAELLSRRPSRIAAELLRGRAAELATSALGSDQVLSLALETAAGDLEEGRPPLDQGALFLLADAAVLAGARARIRNLVIDQPIGPEPALDALVSRLERRLADDGLTPVELSARLLAEARLQEAIWDNPRLPADTSVRHAMLCSVPRLAERAAELDPEAAADGVGLRRPTTRRRSDASAILTKPPPADGQGRWSSQSINWLLLGGLLAAALVASVAPLWRGLLALADGMRL